MNRVHEPAHYLDGKRTPEGEQANNERARLKRQPEIERRAREKEQREHEVRPEFWSALLYRTWTPEDVARWYAEAERLGARISIAHSDIPRIASMELVPNEPFREAFYALNQDVQKKAVQVIINELDKIEARDGKDYGAKKYRRSPRLLMRALGGEQRWVKTGEKRSWLLTIFMPYAVAEACCKALRLDPIQCGI